MQVSILGEFQVRADPSAPWQQAPSSQVGKLGSILACWPGQVVESQALIRALWGTEPPRTAVNTLQVHVSRLRRMLGSPRAVAHRTRGYLLDVPPGDIDAEAFEGLMVSARGHCLAEAYALAEPMLREALALWRGTPFLGVEEAEVAARRARLEELRHLAREQLVLCRIRLAADDFARDAAVADAWGLARGAPDRVRGQELLAEALQAAGRDSEAQAVRSGTNPLVASSEMKDALRA